MSAAEKMQQLSDPKLAYHRLRAALAAYGRTPAALDGDERAAVEQQAQREYALESRILGAREAADAAVPAAVVEEACNTIATRYPGEEEFVADLARNELDPDELRAALERTLRVESVLERVASRSADISELDVKIYYWMHRDRFEVPESRSVRHVLITVNPDFPENTPEAARRRIEQIAKRVGGKRQRFEEQASKHSECPSAMHGGLLGRLPRGKLYPELDEVLFAMQEGEVSGVVETEVGLHVLFCEQIHPAGPAPFEEVEGKIRERLETRRKRMCQRSWIKGLA